jgi:alginate O-acetyltransferase complex protein AlgI
MGFISPPKVRAPWRRRCDATCRQWRGDRVVIFTEVRFIVLVVVCWVSFFTLPPRYRAHVLTFWGVVFYGVYAGRYLPLIVALVLGVYVLSQPRSAWIAVAGVAAVLCYFKAGAGPSGLAPVGMMISPSAAALIPLGLSFLVFELMHFAIERRRGRIGDTPLVDLAAFAFFFPCRIAGPIKRFPDFKQAVLRAEASVDNIYAGLVRIALGLVKKLALADVLALTVAEASYAQTPAHVWKVVLAYSLQIFFDFSAYSDIAIGVSRVLGIRVPENFRWPYLSANIQEFWSRWHMSLSSWVRDYVFLPLGQESFRTRLRRRPLVIAALSYGVSFLIIGAWHGLASNYLVWGLYHGALLTGYHGWRASMPRVVWTSRLYRSPVSRAAGTVITFGLVSVGWVPFMTTLPNAWRLLRLMFAVT